MEERQSQRCDIDVNASRTYALAQTLLGRRVERADRRHGGRRRGGGGWKSRDVIDRIADFKNSMHVPIVV